MILMRNAPKASEQKMKRRTIVIFTFVWLLQPPPADISFMLWLRHGEKRWVNITHEPNGWEREGHLEKVLKELCLSEEICPRAPRSAV